MTARGRSTTGQVFDLTPDQLAKIESGVRGEDSAEWRFPDPLLTSDQIEVAARDSARQQGFVVDYGAHIETAAAVDRERERIQAEVEYEYHAAMRSYGRALRVSREEERSHEGPGF